MSGYSEYAAVEAANSDAAIKLLTKPFSRALILRAVQEILACGETQLKRSLSFQVTRKRQIPNYLEFVRG